MKQTWMFAGGCLTLLVGLAAAEHALAQRAGAAPAGVPRFEVDPKWPTLPAQWTLGQVAGLDVDSRDHVWIIQRPWSLESDEKAQNPDAACCTAAPPVMEFDAAGNYVQGWGGEGEGFEWPADEHTIHVDHKDNVWISSAGGPRMGTRKENQILKFSRAGRFLLQVGRRGMSQGSLDTKNFNNAADIFVYAKTNEVFVADGYLNRRIIVLDADTGAFKRMWGAYGNVPDDSADEPAGRGAWPAAVQPGSRRARVGRRPGVRRGSPQQPAAGVHAGRDVPARDLRGADRRSCWAPSFSIAFSRDPAQHYLFLADAGNGKVRMFDRRTLEEVGSIGRIGRYAGQFIFLHNVAVDSAGNLYTAEVGGGRRVQKFLLAR